jgi:excisionase family DNA binding protein
MEDTTLLTVPQLAEKLQISKNKVRLLYRERKIPIIKLGYRNIRFLWSDVLQALKVSSDPRVKEIRENQPELQLA